MRHHRVVPLLRVVVSALAIHCTQESGARPESSPTRRDANQSWTTYQLVLEGGQPLPVRDSQPYCESETTLCERTLVAGWYRLSRNRFQMFDSMLVHCPCERGQGVLSQLGSGGRSGSVRYRGDTLVFEFFDARLRTVLHLDEGRLRGDTLYTGGSSDLPARVYLKR
jgi:hypothetical protein